MQKVVSNSSPIIHLAKIGKFSLLREYYNTIMVPESVFKECVAEGKDRKEVEAIKKAEWIRVAEVQDRKLVKLLQSSLDDGESEAIALSLESGADLILLDDADAREKARIYDIWINRYRNTWSSFTCEERQEDWFFKRKHHQIKRIRFLGK